MEVFSKIKECPYYLGSSWLSDDLGDKHLIHEFRFKKDKLALVQFSKDRKRASYSTWHCDNESVSWWDVPRWFQTLYAELELYCLQQNQLRLFVKETLATNLTVAKNYIWAVSVLDGCELGTHGLLKISSDSMSLVQGYLANLREEYLIDAYLYEIGQGRYRIAVR